MGLVLFGRAFLTSLLSDGRGHDMVMAWHGEEEGECIVLVWEHLWMFVCGQTYGLGKVQPRDGRAGRYATLSLQDTVLIVLTVHPASRWRAVGSTC